MLEEGLKAAVAKVGAHLDALEGAFVSRRALLELVMLGLLTREHVLLIGPPGTGKSAAVQALARALDASTFDYLIGRFTEPGELFGALDLDALRDGQIRPVTKGMLPEAEVAFLDEIFLGSTAILNSLLKILNERTYRRGQFGMSVPLISCIAASNELPQDTALAAFADRFLLTMFVDPVGDEALGALIQAGWDDMRGAHAPVPPLEHGVLATLQAAVLEVDLAPIHDDYAHIARKIRLLGLSLSDRKLVKGLKLIAASALLRGSLVAGKEDLWPVTYLVQSRQHQSELRQLLHAELQHSRNPVLTGSVAQATHDLTAHAAQLGERATHLLQARPQDGGGEQIEHWLVRLETMLTRIDAAFAPDAMPPHLAALHKEIETALAKGADTLVAKDAVSGD
ncbi:AAA family ATPase [Novosphingobium terrae]|uniref:AAA family ATPase n=1 Tax=Novosphingobium terrae TaxID=2726189 RepID=UPI00197FD496|nr:AAA family ATPase [Novosphingobium terrae]